MSDDEKLNQVRNRIDEANLTAEEKGELAAWLFLSGIGQAFMEGMEDMG